MSSREIPTILFFSGSAVADGVNSRSATQTFPIDIPQSIEGKRCLVWFQSVSCPDGLAISIDELSLPNTFAFMRSRSTYDSNNEFGMWKNGISHILGTVTYTANDAGSFYAVMPIGKQSWTVRLDSLFARDNPILDPDEVINFSFSLRVVPI